MRKLGKVEQAVLDLLREIPGATSRVAEAELRPVLRRKRPITEHEISAVMTRLEDRGLIDRDNRVL